MTGGTFIGSLTELHPQAVQQHRSLRSPKTPSFIVMASPLRQLLHVVKSTGVSTGSTAASAV
jgi:hypothetical protein